MSEKEQLPIDNDRPAPSVLWWVVERATRIWARSISLLSRPGFTTPDGRPPLRSQPFRYTSTREAVYLASLLLATLCTFGAPWELAVPGARWPWAVVIALAAYQITEFIVFLFRLALFGSHANYKPSAWKSATRKQRERTVIVLMVTYTVVLMWFAALYRALDHLWSGQVTVGSNVTGTATGTDAFVLSFSTQTTVGYGTVAPSGPFAAAAAAIQAMFGVFYVAVTIANVLAVLNEDEPDQRLPKAPAPAPAQRPAVPAPAPPAAVPLEAAAAEDRAGASAAAREAV